MNLARNIKKIARQYGLTMKAISEKMNIHSQSLSASIHNNNVKLSTLQAIAKAIGCNISDFFITEQQQTTQDKTKQENNTRLMCPYCNKHIKITITAEQDTTSNRQ